jgi:hypothetical protein
MGTRFTVLVCSPGAAPVAGHVVSTKAKQNNSCTECLVMGIPPSDLYQI